MSCDQTDDTDDSNDFDVGGDGSDGSDGSGSSDSSCISDDCWTYDENTKQCELNPKCAQVKCEAKEMSVVFSNELFGKENGAESISPTPVADENTSGYVLQCELGQCGMKHFVEKDT